MKRVAINTRIGVVWIDGEQHLTTRSVAALLELLIENRDQLVTNDQIEDVLGIKQNTRYAYLRGARKLAALAGLRVRSIKGEGVVLEEVEIGAAA